MLCGWNGELVAPAAYLHVEALGVVYCFVGVPFVVELLVEVDAAADGVNFVLVGASAAEAQAHRQRLALRRESCAVRVRFLARVVVVTEMDSMRDWLGEMFAQIGDRFDRMDDRFDRMDDRFDRMDDRLDRMDGRFDRMDDRFDRLEERMDQVAAVNGTLIDEVAAINRRLT